MKNEPVPGQLITGAGCVLLIVSPFLPWAGRERRISLAAFPLAVRFVNAQGATGDDLSGSYTLDTAKASFREGVNSISVWPRG